jgi:hypothetical protein
MVVSMWWRCGGMTAAVVCPPWIVIIINIFNISHFQNYPLAIIFFYKNRFCKSPLFKRPDAL